MVTPITPERGELSPPNGVRPQGSAAAHAGSFLPCTFSILSGQLSVADGASFDEPRAPLAGSEPSLTGVPSKPMSPKGASSEPVPLAGVSSEPVPLAGESSESVPLAGASSESVPLAGAQLTGAQVASAQLNSERKKELLCQEILRNITLILNSHSHPRLNDLQGDEQLAFSVLGMGLGDFCGRSYSYLSLSQLQQLIYAQIVYFEPRLDPESVQVRLLTDSTNQARASYTVSMDITAKIRPSLLENQVFSCTTVLDLESGANVVRLKSGRI